MVRRRERRRAVELARTKAPTVVAGTAQSVSGWAAAHPQVAAAKKMAAEGTKTTSGMLTDEAKDQLIKKLSDLRDAGVLSDEEFAAKKAKLLP